MKSLVSRSSQKSLSGIAMVLLLLSCNGNSPTAPAEQAPPPTANRPGIVWGYVFDPLGACLRGPVVEVLDGARAGAKSTQNDCNFDEGLGYSFRDLPPGINVRVRASKEGYRSQEATFFATSGPAYQSNITLSPE